MYIMQSIHASKVVNHMNKMYGDFGKFTESPKGNVNFKPIVEMSNHSQVATEIKVYASGYNAALDEAAAAELADYKLLDLERSLWVVENMNLPKNSAGMKIAAEARAAIAKAKGE